MTILENFFILAAMLLFLKLEELKECGAEGGADKET